MALKLEDGRYIKVEPSINGLITYSVYENENIRLKEKVAIPKYNKLIETVKQDIVFLKAQITEDMEEGDLVIKEIELLSAFVRDSETYILSGLEEISIPTTGLGGKTQKEIDEIVKDMRTNKSVYETGEKASLEYSDNYNTFKDKPYLQIGMTDC